MSCISEDRGVTLARTFRQGKFIVLPRQRDGNRCHNYFLALGIGDGLSFPAHQAGVLTT